MQQKYPPELDPVVEESLARLLKPKKNASRLELVKPQEPETPSAEQIEEALDSAYQMDLAQFADNLGVARTIWRAYPDLVKAPVFPENLRAACIAENGYEPEDVGCGEEVLEPGYRETLRPRAIECARERARKERDEAAAKCFAEFTSADFGGYVQ